MQVVSTPGPMKAEPLTAQALRHLHCNFNGVSSRNVQIFIIQCVHQSKWRASEDKVVVNHIPLYTTERV